MKEMMDISTILFKGDNFSLAYNENYFKKNFHSIIERVKDATHIYFKFKGERGSWFNIRHSFDILNGFELEKYFNGFRLHKLSGSLQEIPETIYTDRYGYIYTIPRRDGLSILNFITRFQENQITGNKSIDFSGNLIVDFNVDISNALITLKCLFYPYVKVTNNRIKFLQSETFYNSNEPQTNEVQVFLWENLLKQDPISPISRDEEWFVFQNNIDQNSVMIYNGVMYRYQVNLNNPKRLKIEGLSVSDYSTFDISRMKLIKFVHTDPTLEVSKIDFIGNNNYSQNFSQFTEDISNAMVLYNGIYHSYTLSGNNKVVNYAVPQTLHSFSNGVVSATQFAY